MSFSSEVKKELSPITNFSETVFQAEWIGYCLCGNMLETIDNFEFVTENEFNIEHFYKILFDLNIEYEPEKRGKCFVAQIPKESVQDYLKDFSTIKGETRKNIVKGAFLGSGYVNNPEKNYHLEMIFGDSQKSDFISQICKEYGVNFKKIKINTKYQLYLKEAEEISRFLALIGANRAVLRFEEVRVMKEMKNKVNRTVNCETANLNKTIDAALKQMEDIHFIQKKGKFDQLPQALKEVAMLRLENPDLSLKDLSEQMKSPIGKSGINRRLKKIHEFAENLREDK